MNDFSFLISQSMNDVFYAVLHPICIFLPFSPCEAAIIYPNYSGQPGTRYWAIGARVVAWAGLCKANYYTNPDINTISPCI